MVFAFLSCPVATGYIVHSNGAQSVAAGPAAFYAGRRKDPVTSGLYRDLVSLPACNPGAEEIGALWAKCPSATPPKGNQAQPVPRLAASLVQSPTSSAC